MQYKNTLKINVLQMPCKFIMIFYGIFEDFRHLKHCRRGKHLATRVEGTPTPPGCAPLSRGPTVAPLHLFLHPHTPSSQKITIQHKHEIYLILLQFSISLLKAPTKLLGGIVPWYVTPPLVQLVFVLVLYSLQIFAA